MGTSKVERPISRLATIAIAHPAAIASTTSLSTQAKSKTENLKNLEGKKINENYYF